MPGCGPSLRRAGGAKEWGGLIDMAGGGGGAARKAERLRGRPSARWTGGEGQTGVVLLGLLEARAQALSATYWVGSSPSLGHCPAPKANHGPLLVLVHLCPPAED